MNIEAVEAAHEEKEPRVSIPSSDGTTALPRDLPEHWGVVGGGLAFRDNTWTRKKKQEKEWY